MKSTMSGRSFLNPHAASFVPLSRTTRDEEKDSQNHDETLTQPQHLLESNTETMPESLQVNTHPSPPQDISELIEEDTDVDIEFLKMMFPGFAEQSLRDVYFVNYANMNDTIEMLDYFEFECDEPCETVDVNVSESLPTADSASPKSNNA